jgi:hypothetical protein
MPLEETVLQEELYKASEYSEKILFNFKYSSDKLNEALIQFRERI